MVGTQSLWNECINAIQLFSVSIAFLIPYQPGRLLKKLLGFFSSQHSILPSGKSDQQTQNRKFIPKAVLSQGSVNQPHMLKTDPGSALR